MNSLARKSGRILWIFLAFVGVTIFAPTMQQNKHGWFNLLLAFFGAAYFTGSVLYLIFGKAYQLVVDESGVRGQINWRHRVDLSWTEIRKVGFVGQRLKLQINDGTTKSISLACVTYTERQDIKGKLQSILADHGIAIL